MLYAPLGFKIMFVFDMPDGSKNGGLCDNPMAIPKIFEIVMALGGTNLVIEDKTFYKENELNDGNSVSTL
jgi:hypothetical protein